MMAMLLVLVVFALILAGYPVSFTLAGAAILFAILGLVTGTFNESNLINIPERIYGYFWSITLIAIPLFIYMGVMLERSKIANQLLDTMALLFGSRRGGLGISVIVVGALLAASTGIVGATVVTMGLLSLPVMLKRGYLPSYATGVICSSGTLGQIIPPSIVLIILADVLSNAVPYHLKTTNNTSTTELFQAALIPGLILVALYIVYTLILAKTKPETVPAVPQQERDSISRQELTRRVFKVLIPPLVLIVLVLGSIITGATSPTYAAAVGAVGATVLAIFYKQFNLKLLNEVMRKTLDITSMVMMILIAAAIFSLVFRGFGGDKIVEGFLATVHGYGGTLTVLLLVMLVIFLLGFVLDFFEIALIVVPLVAPPLIAMGVDVTWLGIMIAINLQTSFLTPPFGFSLFYLRGVAPPEVATTQIYKGVIPFIGIQVLTLIIIGYWDGLVSWLPNLLK